MIHLEILKEAVMFSNLLVLMSIGLTLTYMTLKVPNFSHGDFATLGAYAAYTLYKLMGAGIVSTVPVAFLFSGAVALMLYYVVFRPLWKRGAGIVVLMIASIALEIAIRSCVHIYADVMTAATPPDVFFRGFMITEEFVLNIGGLVLPGLLTLSTLMVVVLVVSLYILLTKTKFGIAMRAAIENPSLASTVGINVDLVYAVSWVLAGGLAGAAGALIPLYFPCDPESGWWFLLRIFTVTILGGLSGLWGTIVSGYIVGFSEVIGIYLLSQPPLSLSTAYRPAIALLILVITLLVAPKGLSGIEWDQVMYSLKKRFGGVVSVGVGDSRSS